MDTFVQLKQQRFVSCIPVYPFYGSIQLNKLIDDSKLSMQKDFKSQEGWFKVEEDFTSISTNTLRGEKVFLVTFLISKWLFRKDFMTEVVAGSKISMIKSKEVAFHSCCQDLDCRRVDSNNFKMFQWNLMRKRLFKNLKWLKFCTTSSRRKCNMCRHVIRFVKSSHFVMKYWLHERCAAC